MATKNAKRPASRGTVGESATNREIHAMLTQIVKLSEQLREFIEVHDEALCTCQFCDWRRKMYETSVRNEDLQVLENVMRNYGEMILSEVIPPHGSEL